jgi:hypothetical protein
MLFAAGSEGGNVRDVHCRAVSFWECARDSRSSMGCENGGKTAKEKGFAEITEDF